MIAAVRVCAVFLGLVLLLSAGADLLGVVPRSEDVRPAPDLRAIVVVVAAIALLLPYRSMRRQPWRGVALFGVALTVLGAAVVTLDGLLGYVRGLKSWHVVPVVVLLVAVIAANAYAFLRITRREP